ncbi:MAG: SDR family oxidoreductase [Candidatus Lokiarchaeota archaeon]|nr:SDR family oxidoreductase [Candidatus Lokiarchaeota archaeon]
MKENYYKNKNVVITGAASGIGRTFALELAKMGANLVISDINMERLEDVKKELEIYDIKVVSKKCDVTKKSHIKNLRDAALLSMQDIHFLFSNAGIVAGGHFENFSDGSWRNIFNTNIWGMINLVDAFIPKMLEQGFGHIIVVSSVAGVFGVGGLVPYCTSKFANFGFCEALYGEFNDKGIDVSIICPFPIKTNLIETANISYSQDLIKNYDPEQLLKAIDIGKKHYWNKFTEGGYELEPAIRIYLKRIAKKKLYISERKLTRFLIFIKGFWPNLYKKFIRYKSYEHCNLIDESTQKAIDFIEKPNKTAN